MAWKSVHLLGFCFLLSACQSPNNNTARPLISWTGLVASQHLAVSGQWAIDNSATLYVARSNSKNLTDALQNKLMSVFQQYYPHARVGSYPESLEQSFISAQYAGIDFLVYPRVHIKTDQKGIDRVFQNEIYIDEMEMGQVDMDIMIFATQGRQLVDHIKLDVKGGILTKDHLTLLWPALSEYLRNVSQFGLAGN